MINQWIQVYQSHFSEIVQMSVCPDKHDISIYISYGQLPLFGQMHYG